MGRQIFRGTLRQPVVRNIRERADIHDENDIGGRRSPFGAHSLAQSGLDKKHINFRAGFTLESVQHRTQKNLLPVGVKVDLPLRACEMRGKHGERQRKRRENVGDGFHFQNSFICLVEQNRKSGRGGILNENDYHLQQGCEKNLTGKFLRKF